MKTKHTAARKTLLKHGIVGSILAGILFAVVQMIGALFTGRSPTLPWRAAASILMGPDALNTALVSLGSALLIGLVVHLTLSILFGALYGIFLGNIPGVARRSYAMQVPLGIVYGLILYIVNFQIIARLFLSWLLAPNPLFQMIVHAFGYGLLVALYCAWAEHQEPSGQMARERL